MSIRRGGLLDIAEDGAACAEDWWGSRLACVVLDLRIVGRELLEELLEDAWRRKAPKRLVRGSDAQSP
jgi:hypothetical protein